MWFLWKLQLFLQCSCCVVVGWLKVIARLVIWHDINLNCACAVVRLKKCIFGGVRLDLVVVVDYRSFFGIHANFKLLVWQLLWPWFWAELLPQLVRCWSCSLSVSFLLFNSSRTLKSPFTKFFCFYVRHPTVMTSNHIGDIRGVNHNCNIVLHILLETFQPFF
jgi:hypothetical protein